ncbi:MAG: substrate-binding domain-containing protein, partial [Lentisphaeria bacterium]|nr:substrate-binding domain-containing protein [Lentisphaeria bacterium]
MNIHDFIVPENLRNRSIDGCILAGSLHDDALEKIAEIRMPIVVLGGRRIRHQVPIISRDSLKENGFFLDYALKHGHTRIWIASKSANTKHDFGILQKERPQLQIRLLDGQHKGEIVSAHRWAKRFLTLPQKERPTLIFGADQFCCVMARELARNGVPCPDQISFMSFSDTEMSACCNPALTVYSENHFDVGYRGAKVLFEILEKKLSPEESIRLATREMTVSNLIERESVKDLKNCSHR